MVQRGEEASGYTKEKNNVQFKIEIASGPFILVQW